MLFLSSQKPINIFILYIIYIGKGGYMLKAFSINLMLGGIDSLFKTLLSFIIIDYITLILRSFYNKKVSTKLTLKTFIKKLGYLVIIFLSVQLDKVFESSINIRNIIILVFIANEGLAIVDNWTKMGIKIPKILRNKLDEINKTNDEE